MMKKANCTESTLAVICSVFDGYSAVLFLPEAEEECRLAASFSLGDYILPAGEISPDKGLVGWIARNRQPLRVPSFDRHKNRLGYYPPEKEADIKAFMGCPVPGGGVLCVDSKRPYAFPTDKESKILQLFSELIGQQQRLTRESPDGDIPRYFAQLGIIRELRFRHKRWPVFLEHFLHAVRKAADFDYCAFASCAPDSQSYTIEGETARLMRDGQNPSSLPTGSGIVGWVFRNEQPVFAEAGGEAPTTALFGKVGEIQNFPNFPTVMCLPVAISQSTRGVLCLAHTTAAPIPEAVRAFARQAADHLALFLENLYLRTRLRELMPKAEPREKSSGARTPETPSAPGEL
jgi:GAF domain-containing protein